MTWWPQLSCDEAVSKFKFRSGGISNSPGETAKEEVIPGQWQDVGDTDIEIDTQSTKSFLGLKGGLRKSPWNNTYLQ